MKTADLIDDFQEELQSCEIQFRNYGNKTEFHGPCRTVKCKHDNQLVKKTLSERGDGHILVVDGEGSLSTALMGDLIAAKAFENGWAGVVINGAIRDTAAIGKIDIGVKAIGSNPMKSSKKGLGEVDIEVSFGGVSIAPGDWLYSDEDGVVIAKRELPL